MKNTKSENSVGRFRRTFKSPLPEWNQYLSKLQNFSDRQRIDSNYRNSRHEVLQPRGHWIKAPGAAPKPSDASASVALWVSPDA